MTEEGDIGSDELTLVVATQMDLYEVSDEEVIEVHSVQTLVVEESVLLDSDVDEAESCLEGIDLPPDEA